MGKSVKESKKSIKNNKSDKILEIKIASTGAFKQVIERISNVVSDCSIDFLPQGEGENENKKKKSEKSKKVGGGIRIFHFTEDRSIIIKLKLDAANFDYFRCDEPKITIGVDMHQFYSMIKTISDDYPMVMYMNRDNRGILYIRSFDEDNNEKISEGTDIEIKLIEINNTEVSIPKKSFQSRVIIASDKLHTICKHLNNNSLSVEITSVNDEILFIGENDGGKVTMTYKDNNIKEKNIKSNQVVQGKYELKNLMIFSKCNKLCNTIGIYLRNDYPLVLAIPVANLGKMYVFIAPIEDEKNKLI
jgi:proliferating cell nuclear antigen PCNA